MMHGRKNIKSENWSLEFAVETKEYAWVYELYLKELNFEFTDWRYGPDAGCC